MINYIISLPKIFKQLIMLLVDSTLVILILISSFSLRLEYIYLPVGDPGFLILFLPMFAIPIFYWFGFYQLSLRFIGLSSVWKMLQGILMYCLLWPFIGILFQIEGIPRSVIIINLFIAFFFIIGVRFFFKYLLNRVNLINISKVIIFGAGSAGRQLSNALSHSSEFSPIAFIDDNIKLHGNNINGVVVYSRNKLKDLIKKNNVRDVFIAIPSLNNENSKNILFFLESLPIKLRTLPTLDSLLNGKVNITDLQEVNIESLLGRSSVKVNTNLLSKNITDKVVLVTGAGGSIGSELCRQILFLKPTVLILIEISEFALYKIDNELSNLNLFNTTIKPILCSVTNEKKLSYIFKKFKVHTIYHSAAYKHVPIVEFNTSEGVINNFFGTLRTARAAIEANVKIFVLISTDKAVRPTNTMGVTKRCAEMVLQGLSQDQLTTIFTIVRFGNVLGSSGSVIPKFKEQISLGGPVTVTNPKMIRYFMTISEAVELVIQSGTIGKSGEVLLLDMGSPIKIIDLAKKMIRLSGLEVKDKSNPDGDIEILYSGTRPGEKLFEELLIDDDALPTEHPKIMRAIEKSLEINDILKIVDSLEVAIDRFDNQRVRELLIEAVPEFEPQCEIEDLLFKS